MRLERRIPQLTWRTATTMWSLSINERPDQKRIIPVLRTTVDTLPIKEVTKADPDSTDE